MVGSQYGISMTNWSGHQMWMTTSNNKWDLIRNALEKRHRKDAENPRVCGHIVVMKS
jgi:hypothetical protein